MKSIALSMSRGFITDRLAAAPTWEMAVFIAEAVPHCHTCYERPFACRCVCVRVRAACDGDGTCAQDTAGQSGARHFTLSPMACRRPTSGTSTTRGTALTHATTVTDG